MLIKTRAGLAEQVSAAVKELHSYTTPAVMVLPVESLDPAYHAWIVKETGSLRKRNRRALPGDDA